MFVPKDLLTSPKPKGLEIVNERELNDGVVPVFWALVASKKLKNVLKTLGFRAGKAEPNPPG
jgi:hypothetical protein